MQRGLIKKTKALPKISPKDELYQIPSGWIWTRLGNLTSDIHYGYTASADESKRDTRLLRITDIQNNKVDWERVPGCEIRESDKQKYLLENNDILIARTGGTIGKNYIVENINLESVFASYLIRMRKLESCLLYTSPSPRDQRGSRMPSSA